jgi:hypothetical protein
MTPEHWNRIESLPRVAPLPQALHAGLPLAPGVDGVPILTARNLGITWIWSYAIIVAEPMMSVVRRHFPEPEKSEALHWLGRYTPRSR